MPKRPVKRITFTVEQWPAIFRVRAALYEEDVLLAAASRTITMSSERAETVDAAELMHLLDVLTADVRTYVGTEPLRFA